MKSETHVYTVTETVRVPVDALKRGMYVSELDRSWDETPFLFQGFRLETEDDIRTIQKYCEHVFIDVKQSKQLEIKKDPDTPAASAISTKITSYAKRKLTPNRAPKTRIIPAIGSKELQRDLKPAIRTYNQTNRLVKSLMDEIRLGNSVNTPAAKETVANCVDSVIRNPDAMLLLSRLKNKDEYTSEHSLNVSIISIAFARHIGMDRDQLNEIGLCGMLHDMGKIVTPQEVLNKPGRLEGEEIEIMKRHPADGREILMASSGIHDSVIDVAYGHHERLDGSGYPRGVESDKLSLYTKMVTIADVFDAVTSDRVYRDGTSAFEALRILHAQRGTNYDPSLIIKFIECVGIFPIGTVVELHNGEIGLVIQTHPTYRLKPKIKLLLDQHKKLAEPRVIDLANGDLDANGQPYRIKGAHNPKKFNIDLKSHVHHQDSADDS